MPGWELRVERLVVHKRGDRLRTYGRYDVFIDDLAHPDLAGFICEAPGPGDNGLAGKDKTRVAAGRYQLYRHRTRNYATDHYEDEKLRPFPAIGFLLPAPAVRDGLLVHGAHEREGEGRSDLYLSSVGCLNPTRARTAEQDMDFWESRGRVVAMLASLRTYAAGASPGVGEPFANCWIDISGEPPNPDAQAARARLTYFFRR